MKKVITGLALAGCVMVSPVALAANQTVSVAKRWPGARGHI